MCSHIECSIRREAQRQGRPFCMHVEPGDPRRCLPVAVVPRASAGATALGLEGSQEGVPGEDTPTSETPGDSQALLSPLLPHLQGS